MAPKIDRSLSVQSATLISLNDILAAITVIATGAIILLTGYHPVDSVVRLDSQFLLWLELGPC